MTDTTGKYQTTPEISKGWNASLKLLKSIYVALSNLTIPIPSLLG